MNQNNEESNDGGKNMSEIVANMALAHELIMNDNFQLKSINDVSENRYSFIIF